MRMDGAAYYRRWQGGLFAEGLAGRQPAWISLSSDGLEAMTEDGRRFAMPTGSIRLELGGTSGRMLYARDDSQKLIFICEEADLLRAIERDGPPPLRSQLESLVRAAGGRRWIRRIGYAVAAVVLFLAIGGGPRLLRAAASRAAAALPITVDEAIGSAAARNMDLGGPELDAPRARAALQAMLDRLGPHVARRDVRFRAHLVRNGQANAFALPGGEMVVWSGLLARAETPEQAAGVLAHEMAHATCRHGVKRMIQSIGMIGAAQLLFGDADGLLAAGRDLVTLAQVNRYSREQEAEADAEAVAMMARAGLDPRALIDFFRLIEQEPGAGSAVPSWLSTHPDPAARRASLKARIDCADGPARPLGLDWADVLQDLKSASPVGVGASIALPAYPQEGSKP
jgi:Zn-dependent protease with chaperone function